jgi:hypothetical protein
MRIVVVCVVRRRGVRGRIIRDGSCCGRLGRRRNESLFRPILLLIPPHYWQNTDVSHSASPRHHPNIWISNSTKMDVKYTR